MKPSVPLMKDNDGTDIGQETLRRMASVDRYNRWLFSEISPFVGQRVVEIGCGIGNMTPYFLDREIVVAVDLLPESVEHVQQEFDRFPNVTACLGDILDGRMVAQLRPHCFDTVVCFNVLEHIENDRGALDHMHQLLEPGGRLALVVPAMPLLYGTLDRGLGHHRRYTREGLKVLMDRVGFETEELSYLNLLGIPGWFLSGRVLQQRILPRSGLRTFNILASLFIPLETVVRRVADIPFGQSLVCIARR